MWVGLDQDPVANHYRIGPGCHQIQVSEDERHGLIQRRLGQGWEHSATQASGLGRRLHPPLAALGDRNDDELPHAVKYLGINASGLGHELKMFWYCSIRKGGLLHAPAWVADLQKPKGPTKNSVGPWAR